MVWPKDATPVALEDNIINMQFETLGLDQLTIHQKRAKFKEKVHHWEAMFYFPKTGCYHSNMKMIQNYTAAS